MSDAAPRNKAQDSSDLQHLKHLEIPGNSLIGWNPTAIARVQSLIARVHSLLQFFGSLLR